MSAVLEISMGEGVLFFSLTTADGHGLGPATIERGPGGCFEAVSDVIALTHFYEICPTV